MSANPKNVGGSGTLTDTPTASVHEVFVRSPYNYDVTAASNATAIAPGGPSLTVQAMAEDNDLNVLLKRFGVVDHFPTETRPPMYGDFSHITDYRSALEALDRAEADFMNFPAYIRAQFDNNPQLMLEFAENPANIATVKSWGATNASSLGNSVSAAGEAGSSSGAAASGSGSAAGGAPAAVQSKPA